jgi:hypothetical protein
LLGSASAGNMTVTPPVGDARDNGSINLSFNG